MKRDDYRPTPPAKVTAQNDGERWTLVFVRELHHAPEKVWEALTDPELLAEWLGDDGQAIVEEAEPAERLVLWLSEDDAPGSRVELRLVAVPDGTRVTVTEAPVGPFALAAA